MKKHLLSATAALLLICTGAQAQKIGQLSNVTRLTNSTERFENPRWSPDGSKIAFTQFGYEGLYVMDAKGASKKLLTDGSGAGYGFQWSADSKEILYRDTRGVDTGNGYQDRAHAIWAVDMGGKRTRMTYDANYMQPAAWRYSAGGVKSIVAPDAKIVKGVSLTKIPASMAKKAAANSNNVSFIANGETLVIVNAAGVKNTIFYAPAVCPAISPNGKKIAFVDEDIIYVMNIDGTGKVKIGYGFNPSWGGNTQLVFEMTTDDGHEYTSGELYIANINGSGFKALTATSGNIEMWPCGSPDGAKLVVVSYTDGQVYSADLK